MPRSGVTVRAEPVALDQIVHNLLMNALQALEKVPPGAAAPDAGGQRPRRKGPAGVADTGPGIAPEVLPRIFEPFFSTRAGGLGLGLSLCETLATNMGGALAAAPNEPHGAVFLLSLPLAGGTP